MAAGHRGRRRWSWCWTARPSTASPAARWVTPAASPATAARRWRRCWTRSARCRASIVHKVKVKQGTFKVGDMVQAGGGRRAAQGDPRQPLGHAPAAQGAQAGAGRPRQAGGLGGGAGLPALRLLALRGAHARAARAGGGPGQRAGSARTPRPRRAGDEAGRGEEVRRGGHVRREVRRDGARGHRAPRSPPSCAAAPTCGAAGTSACSRSSARAAIASGVRRITRRHRRGRARSTCARRSASCAGRPSCSRPAPRSWSSAWRPPRSA